MINRSQHTADISTRRGRDRGYAVALTALLLVPLMAVTAIGVDVGVWFVQAQENQRIADAAALAGVVWLPDEAKATSVALEAAQRNGLNPGFDSTVNVEVFGQTQLKVTVSTKSTLSFSSLFLNEFAVTRAAIAEYNPPVALGSPENQLGSSALWLAVSGRCSVRENGDFRSAEFQNAYPGAVYPPSDCTGITNPEYDGEGYLYSITVPTAPAGPIYIEAYDASFSPEGNDLDLDFRTTAATTNFDTEFILYDVNGIPFDLGAHPVIDSRTIGSRWSGHTAQWNTVVQINSPQPGTYYMRVRSSGGGDNSFGSNGFGLRARTGASFGSCSTFSDPDCIQVAAVNDLSLYAALSNGSSTFYLAEVGGEHAGKLLKVKLFDVGEGANSIEILDPDGVPVTFDWTTDCSFSVLAGGCSGTTNILDVSGTDVQLYPDTYSASRFNDRLVIAEIALPANYATAYGGKWWQIRYSFGDNITDRTTWSIEIIGDPVRLSG